MKRSPCVMFLLVAVCAAVALPALAGPVKESDRVNIDLRRTTLIVKDMDASLALYRDALGMKVIYDNWLRRPSSAKTNEEAESATHLVFLRANDPDGHAVECNQLLTDPKEMLKKAE